MKYFVGEWVDTGDERRPAGTVGLTGWTCIDFRPDPTVLDGFCLVAVPDGVTIPGVQVAAGKDEKLSPARKRTVANRIGLNVDSATVGDLALELLTVHASPDGDRSRWNRVRPTIAGRTEVWLGNELLVDLPVVSGGATYTESFNVANVDPFVTGDLSWTNLASRFKIVSNQLQTGAIASATWSRADSDMSTNDNYAQITIVSTDTSAGSRWGITCRYQSGADTCYNGVQGDGSAVNNTVLRKRVAGVNTDLGTSTYTKVTNEVLKVTASGSTITFYCDGVSNITLTDTAVTTGTRGGIFSYVGLTPNSAMDNFSMGDLNALLYRPRDRQTAAINRAAYW